MTRLLVVRHGHVEGIDPPRFRGRIELALTPLGQRQAAAARIAAGWAPAAVLTSPLGRCVATGRAIAAATGAPERALASPPERALASLTDVRVLGVNATEHLAGV